MKTEAELQAAILAQDEVVRAAQRVLTAAQRVQRALVAERKLWDLLPLHLAAHPGAHTLQALHAQMSRRLSAPGVITPALLRTVLDGLVQGGHITYFMEADAWMA